MEPSTERMRLLRQMREISLQADAPLPCCAASFCRWSCLQRFLDFGKGWSENLYQACLKMAICYKCLGVRAQKRNALWEMLRFGIPSRNSAVSSAEI